MRRPKTKKPGAGIDRVTEILHRTLSVDPAVMRMYVMHARYWNKRGVPIDTVVESLQSHSIEEFGMGFVRCRRCAMWTLRTEIDPHTKNCPSCP